MALLKLIKIVWLITCITVTACNHDVSIEQANYIVVGTLVEVTFCLF